MNIKTNLTIAVLGFAFILAQSLAQAQIGSLSTRSNVGTGDDVAVNVFVIQGTGTATVVVRALGPSLDGTLPDPLQDPTLVLNDASGNIVASNDNWRETQEEEIIDSGLAPSSDLESAIVATLPPGSYVATERGNNSTTGMGLNEVYDISPAGGSATITTFGARGRVDAGAPLTTAVEFLSEQQLLVRTLGPSLGAGSLPDPTLSVFDSMGNTITQNDDWMDGPNAFQIQAMGLEPSNLSESAEIVTIPAGTYTYVSDGKNGASGLVYSQGFDTAALGPGLPPIPPTPVPGSSPAPQKLLNISTRLSVQTDDNVLIGGFIVGGTEPKQVLVRGIGPSLGAFGISDALADPILELNKADGTVVTNDNWQDTQESDIPAGLQPSDPLESAILATLEPGNYTAILRGKNNGTGVGLVEAYDLDQAANSTFANISTRGFINTGDNVMIGGFIVDGGDTGEMATIAVRAIGPSLTAFGVAGALQDPTLELHNGDGTTVAENDDWQDGPDSEEFMTNGLAPTEDAESALLATLPPGAYTAIVRGVGDTTGVGLVEAYNVTP